MKNTILICVFSLFTVIVHAQVRFGLRGGANVANQAFKGSTNGFSYLNKSPRISFHIGGMAQFSIKEHFFIQPELLLSSKGLRHERNLIAINPDDPTLANARNVVISESPTYIEIPIYIGAKTNIGTQAKVFGMFGPYLGFGIAGNYKGKYDGETQYSGTISWKKNQNSYQRWDYGLNLCVGAEMKNIVADVRYSLGLANVRPTFFGVKEMHRVVSVSVGYFFKQKTN